MLPCPSCGGTLVRAHRSTFEKVFFADTYRCRKCDRRTRRLYHAVAIRLRFLLSPHTRCISCGTTDVRLLRKKDRVDTLSRSLLSRCMGRTGGSLHSCAACRLQYYDWRPVLAVVNPTMPTNW